MKEPDSPLPLFGLFGGIAITSGAEWIKSGTPTRPSEVDRIDPATNQVVATVDIGGGSADPAVVDDALWFAVNEHLGFPGTLVRTHPAANRVDKACALIDLDGVPPV